MKHIAFLSLCVLLVVVSATPSASFHSKPTPDREIPKEAEAVLHKLKQSCSTKCVDGNYQIKIDSGKGNMNEVICKDFCKFIFFAFKKNQDELFGLAKSGNLNAIDFAMGDMMVLKYGNNNQHELAKVFMEKVRQYTKVTDKKDEL